MLSTRSHGSRLNMIRPGYLSASYRFAQHSTFITVWNNFYYCLDFNTLEIASSFACGLLVHLTRTCLFFEVFRANCCNGFYHSSVRSANGSPGTLVLAHQGCSEIQQGLYALRRMFSYARCCEQHVALYSAKVTTECEYEVICDLWNGVIQWLNAKMWHNLKPNKLKKADSIFTQKLLYVHPCRSQAQL